MSLLRKRVQNPPEALKPFLEENAGATGAMETGLCCRWISALAKSCECDVLVGNARKLAAICQSKQKNDENDALMIAKLARASRCARGGKVARRKAKAAVARKLAVTMLAMLKSGRVHDDGIAAGKAAAGESPVAA